MSDNWDVVVVGSCMIDLVCYAPRLPKPGETICGTHFKTGLGGKGSNQCVASKNLGAKSLLVARVGDDTFGKTYHGKLEECGIPTKHVKMTEGVATGMAQITVADTGENQIVIVSGANNKLSPEDVEEAADVISQCKILMCQLEVSEETTIKALEIKATSQTGKSIFNAAPARPNLDPLLFSLPDIFCVNETEVEVITGIKVAKPKDAETAVKELISRGCKEVIITLGDKGSIYGSRTNPDFISVPAVPTIAVDTTGAGDAFLGALGFYLSTQPNLSITETLRRANAIAGISVKRIGTQESFPKFAELPKEL